MINVNTINRLRLRAQLADHGLDQDDALTGDALAIRILDLEMRLDTLEAAMAAGLHPSAPSTMERAS